MPKLSLRRLSLLLSALFLSLSVFAQKTVTGKVLDSKGPVVGATVTVKGTNTAVFSGTDGGFSIIMPKGRNTLIFSSVGYSTKEIKVEDAQSSLDATLTLSDNSLDEIIITGYTAQKKKDLTGAVAIVKPGDLTKVASPSFAQQIEGRASGVQVTTSGAPGDGASIRIRGVSTFTSGGGEPLVIIDGVQTRGPYFNDINPNDIESIQVLKDAATLASYGIGSTNGVIIITTKKGKSGQPKIEYSGYYGVQQATRGYDEFMIKTSQEYAELVYQSNNNPGLWPLADNSTIARIYGRGPKPVLPDYINPLPALAGQPVNPGTYSYPLNYLSLGRGVLDYSRLNAVRLRSFNSSDIRIDKKWNLKRTTIDLFLDITNWYAAKNAASPSYTFQRTPDNSAFVTTDGNALRPDGSNGIPFFLKNDDVSITPTIGLIIEF